jgi:undecaprenyl-diphosphatase
MTDHPPTFRFSSLRRSWSLAGELWSTTLSWREAPTLLAVLLAAAAGWLLIEVVESVVAGKTAAVDRAIVLWFRSADDARRLIGPPWLQEMMRDFTALGGIGVLALVTCGVATFLILERKRNAAMLLVVATVTGLLISQAAKFGFARPRPDLEPVSTIVLTASFPSGHSTMAAIVYLTCGVLIASYRHRRRVKTYVVVVAAMISLLVGFSRVYLGVHWPTDVLAGLCLGAAWALLCWAGLRVLQSFGYVERETPIAQASEEPVSQISHK